jgi:hypothetical protein
VREVELVPTRGWGGEGALGAVLGYGALHRLPVGLGEEVEGPGEVVFETREDGFEELREGPAESHTAVPPLPAISSQNNAAPLQPTTYASSNFLVPANIASPPPLSPPLLSPSLSSTTATRAAGGRSGRKHRHGGGSPSRAFDEYFAEGEQKSREQDFAPSRKGTPLAPPPKVGVDLTSPPPPQEETSSSPTIGNNGQPT